MNSPLLTIKDVNLIYRIQLLLQDAFHEGCESVELRSFRRLFDWEERFFISCLSRDGKDGVIRYDSIFEMKEVYESNYCLDVSEVEWSEEPDSDYCSGCVEPCELIFDVCNLVLRELKDQVDIY